MNVLHFFSLLHLFSLSLSSLSLSQLWLLCQRKKLPRYWWAVRSMCYWKISIGERPECCFLLHVSQGVRVCWHWELLFVCCRLVPRSEHSQVGGMQRMCGWLFSSEFRNTMWCVRWRKNTTAQLCNQVQLRLLCHWKGIRWHQQCVYELLRLQVSGTEKKKCCVCLLSSSSSSLSCFLLTDFFSPFFPHFFLLPFVSSCPISLDRHPARRPTQSAVHVQMVGRKSW